jgi:diguanylate cyclase (GGDEF)-like protein/PAS domain S-box-containing protein
VRFANINMIKNKLYKIANKVVFNIVEIAKSFFYKMLFEDQNSITNKDSLKYWKNRIFHIVAVLMLTCGAPLFFYGSYMFYSQGEIVYAIVEVFIYIIIAIVITRKSLSVRFRKFFITLALYFISLLLLITTGLMGAGMVCVFSSLMLTGCMLEKKQTLQVITINIIIFIAITVLLMQGYFDGTPMEIYKTVWIINVTTAQTCGIALLFVMNTIYTGLENQTQLIKKSRESLIASEIKHKSMIANISDVIVIVDENGVIKYNSPNLEQRFGWTSEDIYNKPLWEEIHPEDRNSIKGDLQSLLEKDGLKKTMEARYICKNGMVNYIELTAVNLKSNPSIKGILINYHDITQRKMREAKILYLSYHDSLTGLSNRRFFENEKQRLDTERQLPLSVITGDINGLKVINESIGHDQGDKILITIGKILDSSCRKEDILARIGGDEFSILLPGTSSEVADEIIKKINLACEEYNKKVPDELYKISISLGYATKTTIAESLDNIFNIAEEYMYNRKLLEGRSFHSSIISSMKTALFEKSQETEEHAERLIKLTKAIGQGISLTNQQFDELELFSALHDIGKIGIDDGILNKPGKLTDSEWVKMKKHSEVGYRIAMASPELMPVAYYILTHHERFDGKGYPKGLSGESIPLLSRILAVTDSYDAMTEDRPYRKGMSKQDAINEIIKNAGTQFDPAITKIFVEIVTNEELSQDAKTSAYEISLSNNTIY